MCNADRLSAAERERFVDFVQACTSPSIDEDGFRHIVRHHVGQLLPHGCSIAVVASLNIDQIELQRIVAIDYPDAFIAGLSRFTNLRERPLVAQWLQTRSPVIVGLEQGVSPLERREIASFDLGRLALHGQIDITSQMASYFSFARVNPGMSDDKVASILRMVAPHLHGALLSSSAKPTPWTQAAHLTAAEFDILRLLAKGCTNGEIAKARGRSVSTVRNQLHALYEKLQVSGRAEAVALFGSTADLRTSR